MPLPFSDISTLFSRCEDIETHDPPIIPKDRAVRVKETVQSWFTSHRRQINEFDIEGATALLSSLLPERRNDRVYGVQAFGLCRILGRGLSLSAARIKDLQAYKRSGCGDLAQCVKRVLSESGPPALPAVSVSEVDEMLHRLAGHCRFSRPEVKLPPSSSESRENIISNIFKRVSPQEGKWLVRLLLKDLSPLKMNEMVVLKSFHFLLPDLLRFQNTFEAAVRLLKTELREFPEKPDPRSERLLRRGASALLQPAVGIKVGRPDFYKARSIEHCMKMLGGRQWALERKYDGEYCEIHVDLNKSPNVAECIRIFSKSGKDSTLDRQGVHKVLMGCLRLGRPDCKIKHRAILLGELVVYSDEEMCILPFDTIRRHVTRSGESIGADLDSIPRAHEHLAIVFFDLLLLDEEVVMRKPVEERRNWLREVYCKIPGRAIGAEWKIVDFSSPDSAKKRLVDQFAASIARRCEGLVLKPCGVPYFPLGCSQDDGSLGFIKLKKDYINDMGDEADLAVVGASYNAQQAARCDVEGVRWTDFHLGCVVNASDVQRFDDRPIFQIVGTIQQHACIPRPILADLNKLGEFLARQYETLRQPPTFDLKNIGDVRMDVTFDDPFVLEVLGSGFEKPSNRTFMMLRHPRVKKLHRDRTWKDCVSFQDLQQQACAARTAPVDGESQETRRWLAKLEKGHKRKFACQCTPTARSAATPSTTEETRIHSARTSLQRSNAQSPSLKRPTRESEMNDTTLVESTSPTHKRMRDHCHSQTVDSPMKKQRMHLALPQDATTPAEPDQRLTTQILSDITNRLVRSTTQVESHVVSSHTTRERKCPSRPRAHAPKHNAESKPRSHIPCTGSRCPFANSVVLLSPCISDTPYISEDLISSHATIVVGDMLHWDRESFTHPLLTTAVSESQSFADRRKIVLVEKKRPSAVLQVVQDIVALNGGRMRERIETYDWRVLEECNAHSVGAEGLKHHFLGATVFDEAQGRSLFVSTIPWLQS